MSTRSNIKLVEPFGEILLYKHHDGYPEGEHGNVAFITEFLKKSGQSAEWMANEMVEKTEVTPASGIHGDIEYLYEVDVRRGIIKIFDVFEDKYLDPVKVDM